MNKIMKGTATILLALFMVFGLCVGLKPVYADEDTVSLDLTFDYAPAPGKGHSWPSSSSLTELEKRILASWKDLSITITDSKGNKHEVPKGYHFGRGTAFLRDGGNYKDGEELTITIDPSGLPDEYHLSWNGEDGIHQIKYDPETRYYVMHYTITREAMNKKLFYIKMGTMSVDFDMMGGTCVDGDSPITKVVNKDNSVDFPTDPTKENLHFGGWFTRSGERTVFWEPKYSFSDLNRDWKQWNDANVDPMYDGKFVLRAMWNAEVQFDSDGGSDVKMQVVREGARATYPQMPTKKDAKFLYWQTEDGNPYDWSVPVTKDMKLKAVWEKSTSCGKDPLPGSTDADKELSFTFLANGGKWADNTSTKVMTTQRGVSFPMMQAPTREGYTFQYWQGANYNPGDAYEEEKNHTYTAVWKSNTPSSGCPSIPNESSSEAGNMVNKDKTAPKTGELELFSLCALVLLSTASGMLLVTRKRKER